MYALLNTSHFDVNMKPYIAPTDATGVCSYSENAKNIVHFLEHLLT